MTYRQQNSKPPGEWRFGRRGTAMVEFVLVLPLLLTVLAATFFFGWAMMHKHQVSAADRYAVWRRVETGGWPSEDRINEVCFADRAKNVDLVSEAAVSQTARDLVDVAGQQGAPVEILAEELVIERYPGGKRARVSATFRHAMALWAKSAGTITHRHGREGVTWRRDEVSCWATLRDQYYSGLDGELLKVPAPANGMASMVRGLYLARW